MTKEIYGPYRVDFVGPGVYAKIIDEVPPELVGKLVMVEVVDDSVYFSAAKTLRDLGYTYHGGDLWKPPINKPSVLTRL